MFIASAPGGEKKWSEVVAFSLLIALACICMRWNMLPLHYKFFIYIGITSLMKSISKTSKTILWYVVTTWLWRHIRTIPFIVVVVVVVVVSQWRKWIDKLTHSIHLGHFGPPSRGWRLWMSDEILYSFFLTPQTQTEVQKPVDWRAIDVSEFPHFPMPYFMIRERIRCRTASPYLRSWWDLRNCSELNYSFLPYPVLCFVRYGYFQPLSAYFQISWVKKKNIVLKQQKEKLCQRK